MKRRIWFGACVLFVGAGLFLAAARLGEVRRSGRVSPAPVSASNARVVTLEVGGMICGDCVEKIHRELSKVPGVSSAEVSLTGQRAVVTCDASVSDTTLTAAVRRAGPGYLGLIVHR